MTCEELLRWHKEDQQQLADMREVITRLRADLQGALKTVSQYRQHVDRGQLAAWKAQSTNNIWDLGDLVDEALDVPDDNTETHIVMDDSADPEHADDCPGCASPEELTEIDVSARDALTAHARTDVPALLAEVERLRAERSELIRQRDRIAHDVMAALPSRVEVLRNAITAVEDPEQRRATGAGVVGWESACGVLYRLLRTAEAGEPK